MSCRRPDRLFSLPLAITLLALTAGPSMAQSSGADGADMRTVSGDAIEWSPIEVPGFDSGMELAVIHGDPSASGPYTLRLRFPDGYSFPPHWHPMDENLTVLSGTFYLAVGERADESKLKRYVPGDYIFAPARQAHYGGVSGTTVIQLHGMGPFTIELVDAPPGTS